MEFDSRLPRAGFSSYLRMLRRSSRLFRSIPAVRPSSNTPRHSPFKPIHLSPFLLSSLAFETSQPFSTSSRTNLSDSAMAPITNGHVEKPSNHHEVIIIGSGPAGELPLETCSPGLDAQLADQGALSRHSGHTAAIYLARANLHPVMYEVSRPLLPPSRSARPSFVEEPRAGRPTLKTSGADSLSCTQGMLANGIAAGGQLTTTTEVENLYVHFCRHPAQPQLSRHLQPWIP